MPRRKSTDRPKLTAPEPPKGVICDPDAPMSPLAREYLKVFRRGVGDLAPDPVATEDASADTATI